MKNILPVLLLLCASMGTAKAQLLPGVEIGLKGALNFSKLKSEGEFFNSDNKVGYQAGVYGRIGVLGFHIQPEVYITGKNTQASSNDGNESTNVKFTTVDVPLLLGKRFGLGPIGARINTGPVFSFVVDDQQDKNIGTYLKTSNYKKNSTSWAFGAGVDISSLRVDLRYELGLNNIQKDNTEKTKINMWSIGLGYKLFSL
ncbi:PorT family protein [Sphingobacterium sp. SRCM116780]|uniref:porin family protein n=1 Tax=Sphingobacterium sp. SRCM116780 TaxID=2907623 RepID=UPI001F186CD5|nr:porin family protein [Sphingobacterium sp. SRCM116780]UIR55407.1 PorT family protein [Sphingobacterium sp. SRCM116780]